MKEQTDPISVLELIGFAANSGLETSIGRQFYSF
jgi:hypothetical protein